MLRFLIHTFGCQMNRHDAEALAGLLSRAGLAAAASEAEADVVLFETCSVRAHAEERVYSRLGRLAAAKRRRPGLIIGVIGCLAEKDREAVFRRAAHADFAVGPGRLDEVPALIARLAAAPEAGRRAVLSGRKDALNLPSALADRREHPWSAYLAISRGCSNGCAYCVVPAVRGELVSRPAEEVLAEAGALVAAGAVELTLLGQNADAYGQDFCGGQGPFLADLVRSAGRLSARGLRRLAFVTSHPRDISGELLRAMAETPVACPFLHMPAQSGSDRVLAAMRRGYTAGRYREIVALARRTVPGVELASDFIVGFPGETEEDYLATEGLVREMEFQQIFVFKYSPRPGTWAAEQLPDDVPVSAKKERNNRLLAVQRGISLRLNRALLGQTVEVLVEGVSRRDPRRLAGRTRTGRMVAFPRDESVRPGDFVNVRVDSATALTLVGERV